MAASRVRRGPRVRESTGPSGSEAVDRIVGRLGPSERAIARALRSTIRRIAPELREEVKWNLPVWSGRGRVLGLQFFREHVNLGLWRGAELAPRFPEIVGTGNSLRHVRIPDPGAARGPRVARIVRAAVVLDSSGP
jgi:hypothetical protein